MNYLQWYAENSTCPWWCDSAEPGEISASLEWGASGVTLNPVLSSRVWNNPESRKILELELGAAGRKNGVEIATLDQPERIMKRIVTHNAALLHPVYEQTGGRHGYVCMQVHPAKAADRDAMRTAAREYASWAPNVSVKLPTTAAGLEVMEELGAEGICFTMTVSFTVPQVVATAEHYRKALARARALGNKPAPCFAVIMHGRVDEYIRDVCQDSHPEVTEGTIRLAGTALVKRARAIFQERGYEALLMDAAFRSVDHVLDVAGGGIVLSVHPKIQMLLSAKDVPKEMRIDEPVDQRALDSLLRVPEFRKAYAPDGMTASQFISYGVTQKTLSQFVHGGWALMDGT